MTLVHRSAGTLATLLLVAGLAGCTDSEPEPVALDTPPASTPGEPAPAEPPASPVDDATAETVVAPAYFTTQTPLGTRLAREFREVESDDPGDELLALLAAGDTLDPDYGTLLPAGSARLLEGDDTIRVEIPAEWVDRPDGLSAEDARLAIQQVVYSLQGLRQERLPVGFVRDGEPTTMLGEPEPVGGFVAGDQLEVLSLVNLTTPSEGQAVGETFTASGVASSFEATVEWQVRDGADEVVLDGFATAEGWLDRLYPWETVVDVSSLQPGTYTFVALTADPSGGEEGPGPFEDTKTITVP
jgi:hypothetical protein